MFYISNRRLVQAEKRRGSRLGDSHSLRSCSTAALCLSCPCPCPCPKRIADGLLSLLYRRSRRVFPGKTGTGTGTGTGTIKNSAPGAHGSLGALPQPKSLWQELLNAGAEGLPGAARPGVFFRSSRALNPTIPEAMSAHVPPRGDLRLREAPRVSGG